jgi:hypothetical protein
MNWRERLMTMWRCLLGRPVRQEPEEAHYPAIHDASNEIMIQAAELARLKRTAAWRRLQAEADLRTFEQARLGQRRERRQ